MSARFFKLSSALIATLPLVQNVAAVPIPISSPTATALIVYLSVVPASLILLFTVKYLYVRGRKAYAASEDSLQDSSSPQLRMRHRLGHCIAGSDRSASRAALLVGLLGSPDWETKVKESEYIAVEDPGSQFSYAAFLHPKPDSLGHICSGSFLLDIVQVPTSPVDTAGSAYFIV